MTQRVWCGARREQAVLLPGHVSAMLAPGLLVLLVAAAPVAGLARDQLVETSVGPLRGLLSPVIDGRLPRVMQFLGVPYASPPVGYLRFMPPKTPTRKSEVSNATRLAAGCPQRAAAAGAGSRRPQSEDCLYLNIYAPVTEGSQPTAPTAVYAEQKPA